jgi:hypothetical protein
MLKSVAQLCFGLLSAELQQRSLLHLGQVHLLAITSGIASVLWKPTKMPTSSTPSILRVSTKNAVGHSNITLHMIASHEAIDETLQSHAGAKLKLEEARSAHEVPPAYVHHSLVQQHGVGRVWPLGLFADGVSYSKVDTVIGF